MKEAAKEMWEMIPMKSRYVLFFMLGLLSLGTVWFTSCTGVIGIVKKYPQDNIVEEIVEEIIEQKTGLDLDLSPMSEEDDG